MSQEANKKFKLIISITALLVVVVTMGYLAMDRSSGVPRSEIYGEQEGSSVKKEAKSITEAQLIELLQAIDSGDPKQFEKLRVENLRQYQEYNTSLIPVLKNRALKNFTRRASISDWKNWPEVSSDFQNQTKSRVYLNDLLSMNVELGNFLETSGLVFYQISQTAGTGTKADLPTIVNGLQESAESLLAHRDSGFEAKKTLIDTDIKKDTYQKVINEEYSRIVLSYLKEVNSDPFTALKLISYVVNAQNIKDHKWKAELSSATRSEVAKSVLSKDILIRNKIASSPEIEAVLYGFSKNDRVFSVTLAGFYEALSLDYIELGESAKANESFKKAVELAPGRTSQNVIASLLVKDGQQVSDAGSVSKEVNKAPAKEATRVKKSGSIIGMFFKAILLAGIFIGILFGYRKFQEARIVSSRDRDYGSEKTEVSFNDDPLFDEEFSIDERPIAHQIADIESSKNNSDQEEMEDRRQVSNEF